MENELSDKVENKEVDTFPSVPPEAPKLANISFSPEAFLKKTNGETPHGYREWLAFAGLILGVVSVFSWIVLLFGFLYSILGIIFSSIGLKSTYHTKIARTGLGLSVAGFLFSLIYIIAVYQGSVNYNYFTTEFWGM